MVYNKDMKKGRLKRGFTLIEVALFLAISTAVLAAIMYGISTTVARRRYNDAVDGIVEEIKNAYSSAINVENYRRKTADSSFFCSVSSAFNGSSIIVNSSTTSSKVKTDNNPGRSRCAFYGQVITFGETNDSRVRRYDLIGLALEDNIEPEGNDNVLYALVNNAKANIVTMKNIGSTTTTCSASIAGNNSDFIPGWEARIENKADRGLYHGAIMIARSPISGTIHTYYYSYHKGAIDSDGSIKDNPSNMPAFNEAYTVQDWLKTTGTKNCSGFYKSDDYFVMKAMKEGRMVKNGYLEFCVGSDDLYAVGNKRRAIRIHGDGSTEAAVELLSESESVRACGA